MKNVLITGINGLVGSNLARRLLAEGCHVRGMLRERSNRRSIAGLEIELIFGDVRNEEQVLNAVKGMDTVFHTAAIISHWSKERETMFEVNIDGTRNVVSAAMRSNVGRFVHTSSISALGTRSDDGLITEETPSVPSASDAGYRVTKYRSEQIVLEAAGKGLNAVILNPSIIMGPGDYRFHGGRIIKDICRRRIFYSPPGGANVVSVYDVVEGHLAAERQGRTGEKYILAGENHTFADLFRITAEVVGGISPLFRVPMPLVTAIAAISEGVSRTLGVKPWVSRELVSGIRHFKKYSSEKAARELGYTYTSFRETVETTFRWYKQEGLL